HPGGRDGAPDRGPRAEHVEIAPLLAGRASHPPRRAGADLPGGGGGRPVLRGAAGLERDRAGGKRQSSRGVTAPDGAAAAPPRGALRLFGRRGTSRPLLSVKGGRALRPALWWARP